MYPYSENRVKSHHPYRKMDAEMEIPDMIFPIGLTHPIKISLDPNTGELVFECHQVIGNKSHLVRFLMEPKAALTLLSVLPEIERVGVHIIE